MMGKRSDFKRVARDCYDTPYEAVLPLLPWLCPDGEEFVEPCAGEGALIRHLMRHHHQPVGSYDIAPRSPEIIRRDALTLTVSDIREADGVITNPPWDRKFLHALILHMRALGTPTWLLLDANWMFTQQAGPFLKYCLLIVTVGRIKWMPGTTMTGKDDCAWFLFMPDPVKSTRFVGKEVARETVTA